MNPILLQMMQRYGPQAMRFMNSAANKYGQIGIPSIPPVTPMGPGALTSGAPAGPAPPISSDNSGPPPEEPMTPNARVAHGFNMFAPQPQANNAPSPLDNAQWPTGPVGAPVTPEATASVPMPQARPSDAPQPDMGFFARNTAMMRDPSSGAFIDPAAGESAQASGPDVINKLLSYFHNKDNS